MKRGSMASASPNLPIINSLIYSEYIYQTWSQNQNNWRRGSPAARVAQWPWPWNKLLATFSVLTSRETKENKENHRKSRLYAIKAFERIFKLLVHQRIIYRKYWKQSKPDGRDEIGSGKLSSVVPSARIFRLATACQLHDIDSMYKLGKIEISSENISVYHHPKIATHLVDMIETSRWRGNASWSQIRVYIV